jgi:pilus assembly protein TadC
LCYKNSLYSFKYLFFAGFLSLLLIIAINNLKSMFFYFHFIDIESIIFFNIYFLFSYYIYLQGYSRETKINKNKINHDTFSLLRL